MKKQVNRLETINKQLNSTGQKTLLDFAEFLLSRSAKDLKIEQPLEIPGTDDEKVVAAVKRLTKQYFMLDKMKLFPITSQLMTEHIMKGKDRNEVIIELETVFKEHYELYRGSFTKEGENPESTASEDQLD